MEATANGVKEEEMKAVRSASTKHRDFIPIYVPGVEPGLIDRRPRRRRFLDFLKAQPSKGWFLKFGVVGRITTFNYLRRNPTQRQGSSSQNASADGAADAGQRWRRFRVPFVRKINWQFLIKYAKNWIKHPMNMAMLVWLVFVAAGLIVLGLLMVGLLDDAIPQSAQRKRWTEILNQILNALFTIMCLYQHPKIFHHLIILCRWTQKDAVELRMVYSKSSTRRPHERAHMAFIIVLLHLTCFAQYVLIALYWGWTSKTRPEWAENTCIGLGIGAPIIAGLYLVYGPLRRKITTAADSEMELVTDEESQQKRDSAATLTPSASTRSTTSTSRFRVVVTEPQWLGGLFDCWDDITVAYTSFFCTCCVFGWNMERLGFGNMYVHIVTFVLFCIAPLLVFNVSALNISDQTLRYAMGISGVLLCCCGTLYGGFWRIQMRKKFKLPGNPFCCGYPAVTDCFQWLFCWSCSLAQEVRTGNFYEVEEDSFYRRNLEEEVRAALEPLPREGQAGPRSSPPGPVESRVEIMSISVEEGEMPKSERDQAMIAPTPPLIQLQENQQQKS